MRILHVYHIYPAIFGGVSKVVYDVTKELSRRGHNVAVLTTDTHRNIKSIMRIEYESGITIYRFSTILKFLSKHNLVISNPRLIFYIRKIIADFEIIHLHGYRTFQNIIVHNYYARKYNIPYVLQAHGSLPRTTTKRKLKQIYDILFGYRLLNDATKVIALNQTEAKQYKNMGVSENKITIIPNGINLAEYANLPPKGSFRKKFNLPYDKKIVLYLGRIHKSKGIDLIVRSYADLIKNMKHTDVVLVIAGPDDGYLAEVKSLVASLDVLDSIIFTGFLSNADKMKALVDADIFVSPSFYGFPITFLEACATGTPIITTTAGDRLGWIDRKVGLVVEPNEHTLANAMYILLSDQQLREEFSRRAKKLIESVFSLKKIVDKLEQLYESICNF